MSPVWRCSRLTFQPRQPQFPHRRLILTFFLSHILPRWQLAAICLDKTEHDYLLWRRETTSSKLITEGNNEDRNIKVTEANNSLSDPVIVISIPDLCQVWRSHERNLVLQFFFHLLTECPLQAITRQSVSASSGLCRVTTPHSQSGNWDFTNSGIQVIQMKLGVIKNSKTAFIPVSAGWH